MAGSAILANYIALAAASFLSGAAACHLIWVARMTVARAMAAGVATTITEDGPTTWARIWLTLASWVALLFIVLYATGVWSPQQPQAARGAYQAGQIQQRPDSAEAPRITGDLESAVQRHARLKLVLMPLAEAEQKTAGAGEHNAALRLVIHRRGNGGHNSQPADDHQRDVPAVGLPVGLHASPSPAVHPPQLIAGAR